MKFSYRWLKELIPFTEPPENLAHFLTMRAFEVESVERVDNDWAIDIKLPANRVSDASGHRGLAREIAALKGETLLDTAPEFSEQRKRAASDTLTVRVEDTAACPRYTARVMEGVRPGPSPEWLRERLETCGIQSISNVVDGANYIMLETGQPLHVFDADTLANGEGGKKEIIVRPARKKERITTLDEKTYELDPETLLIADQGHPLAIAGVKGGKHSGVGENTSRIVIEAANFESFRIRATSQRLKLRTDASYRYENGLDPNATEEAADRLAALIASLAGGTILHGRIDIYPEPVKASGILFRPAYANRILGRELEPNLYREFFRRIGCAIKTAKDGLGVTPPTTRRDLKIEEDLIEEAALLLGYDEIAPTMPSVALFPPPRNDEVFWEEKIRDIAVGQGFTESQLYEFTGEQELAAFFAPGDNLLELENPASPETGFLVPRIAIKYALSTVENLRHKNHIRIFGIGKQFAKGTDPHPRWHIPLLEEKKMLVFALGKKNGEGEEEFYLLKGAVDELLESMGIAEHWYDDQRERIANNRENRMYHPYRVAGIMVNDTAVGTIGEIHPTILDSLKAKGRIIIAECDMEALCRLATGETEYRPIGKFPAVIRDIAVIVSTQTRTEDILNVIENLGGSNLTDADLFDYYQDEALEKEEEKSLAFHLTFQSPERTLTDKEVDTTVTTIIAALEEKGWEVKK